MSPPSQVLLNLSFEILIFLFIWNESFIFSNKGHIQTVFIEKISFSSQSRTFVTISLLAYSPNANSSRHLFLFRCLLFSFVRIKEAIIVSIYRYPNSFQRLYYENFSWSRIVVYEKPENNIREGSGDEDGFFGFFIF